MSGPAIALGLKIIGGIFAAKTAIDGLKEGNILKAVMGGVSAYFSIGAIGAGLGNAINNTMANPGLSAAESAGFASGANASVVAQDVLGNMASGASVVGPQSLVSGGGGLLTGVSAANDAGAGAFLNSIGNNSPNALASSAPSISNGAENLSWSDKLNKSINGFSDEVSAAINPNKGKGLLNNMGTLFKDNKQLIGAGMQLYAGDRNLDFIEKQMEEERLREEDRRRRMGAAPTVHYNYGATPTGGI